VSWGQNRKYGVWNAYNRVPITLQAGDSTASWTYNVATIRASNNTPSSYSGASFNVGSGTSCNGLTVLCGLAQETISANFLQQFNPNASSGNNLAQIGIGLNSTRAFSAASKMNNNGSNLVVDFPPALYILAPSLGLNVLAELESSNATNANVYQGGSSQIMNLQATWRG
jgi:hypothetical protein